MFSHIIGQEVVIYPQYEYLFEILFQRIDLFLFGFR